MHLGARLSCTVLLAGLAILAGCDRGDQPLPGERIPIRAGVEEEAPTRSAAISLPPAVVNADWTHRNGASGGRPAHPALAPVPQLRWATDIGEGEGRRSRILAAPVVTGGLIFAMDAGGRLSAVGRDGRLVWSQSLVPERQNAASGPGGGIATAGGVLYVATGFGEVFAMNAANGQIRWRKTLEAPIRSAPVVRDGLLVTVLRNDTAYGLDAANGEIRWRIQGAGGTGLLGGATPAADGPLVVIPFASGEVLGVLGRNGLTIWGTAVSGGRRELARNRINDISGDPVIDGGSVYASNQSGRTVRVDRETGERTWTMAEGSYGPAWPVGGSIFLMSDEGQLVRANAATGELIWSTQLPEYNYRRRLFRGPVPISAITHWGPVLAGGRLWVASGDGFLRAFNPVDGAMIVEIALPGGAAAPPAVAGGVLYVVTRDARLLAFQ
jgi:outer membrane protein assembly factor BamB